MINLRGVGGVHKQAMFNAFPRVANFDAYHSWARRDKQLCFGVRRENRMEAVTYKASRSYKHGGNIMIVEKEMNSLQ